MGAPALILVRHARPEISPQVAPPLWSLSAESRAAAIALAARLPPFVAAVASTEPKAIATAEILAASLGAPVARDARLDEHRRETWPFEPGPEAVGARVRQALAKPESSIDGAETIASAVVRFETGLAAYADRPLLIVTHGTVLAAWLAARLEVDARELWAGLKSPEAFVLDGEGRMIGRLS